MVPFIAVLLLFWASCDANVLKDVCATPDAKEGLCVNLQECESIFAMSNDFDTPLTIERLNFLMESQCGYLGNNPRVCCPAEEIAQ